MDYLSHSAASPDALAQLLDSCFGPARHKRTAALLRQGAPRLENASFVAMHKDQLVGSVECWDLLWQHPSGNRRIALLGPLVSHADYRGQKIGTRLMDLALGELDKARLPVFLIGDEPYYGRWNFTAQHTQDWQMPGPVDRDRLLLRATDGHRLRGPAILAPQKVQTAAA